MLRLGLGLAVSLIEEVMECYWTLKHKINVFKIMQFKYCSRILNLPKIASKFPPGAALGSTIRNKLYGACGTALGAVPEGA